MLSAANEFDNFDIINGKQELLLKFANTQDKPEDLIHFARGQSDFFMVISTIDMPRVVVSVEVKNDMSVRVVCNDVELDRSS